MILGVTGTRDGMSQAQKDVFAGMLLGELSGIRVMHEGGCVGADHDAVQIFDRWRLRESVMAVIVTHPGKGNGALEAEHSLSDVVLAPEPNLTRNRRIVAALGPGDVLVAFPSAENMRLGKGGTHWTICYAVGSGRKTVVVMPDGTEARFNG